MSEIDDKYYQRRVEEERAQVGLAKTTSVRSVHEKLLELYGTRIVELKNQPQQE